MPDSLKFSSDIPSGDRVEFYDADGTKLGRIHYTVFMDFIRYDPGMIALSWLPDKAEEMWKAYQEWETNRADQPH